MRTNLILFKRIQFLLLKDDYKLVKDVNTNFFYNIN